MKGKSLQYLPVISKLKYDKKLYFNFSDRVSHGASTGDKTMPSTGDLMDTFVVDEKLDCTWESGSSSSGCGSHFEFPCPQDMLGDIGVEPGTVDWGSGIDDIMIRI